MADAQQLTAEKREQLGKGAARATRRQGRVPAIIYGDRKQPMAISLSRHELEQTLKRGHFLASLFNISVDGRSYRVIPRDLQLDPVRDFPLHVDFLRLGRDAQVTVEVEVRFLNDELSPGIRRGGALNVVRHAVELSCPADSIPEYLEADLADLDIGDALHISSVTFPEGVSPTISDRDFTIATIAAPAGGSSDSDEEEDQETDEEDDDEEDA